MRSSVLLAAVMLTAGCASGSVDGAGTPAQRLPAPHSVRQSPSSSAPRPTHTRAPAPPPTSRSTTAPRTTEPSSPSSPPPPALPRAPDGPTVVLNPGHNGGDAAHPDQISRLVPAGYGNVKECETTGTETNAGYAEHAFNWDVALRVRRILRAHGVRVIMTRHSDTGVGPCVDQRAAIGNAPGVDAVVSIHADGAPVGGHGFHVNQDSRRPDGATARVAHQSIQLGRTIHAALQSSAAGRQQIAGAIAAGILAFVTR